MFLVYDSHPTYASILYADTVRFFCFRSICNPPFVPIEMHAWGRQRAVPSEFKPLFSTLIVRLGDLEGKRKILHTYKV